MKKPITLLGLALALSSPGVLRGQGDASGYLEPITKKFASLRDYTVDVRVHFDMEALKSPDMEGKLYYKAPDKVKVESKKIFFFPKEGGVFNPAMLSRDRYDATLLEKVAVDGSNGVRLKLTPRTKTDERIQPLIVTIDTDHDLVREIALSPFHGREVKAHIDYSRVGDFDLPSKITVELDFSAPPPSAQGDAADAPHNLGRAAQMKGKVEITYSNYTVNSNLSDDIFEERKKK